MKSQQICYVLILVMTIVAAYLRLPRLAVRPMHTDEAVHAVKFGQLLEQGDYRYDPDEYHGPPLYYLTLASAWLGGEKTLTDVTEFTLRIVPVFFGICLILLLLFVADGLGLAVAVCAACFTAISPAMAFYSRYYIPEMLLVCFTFGAVVSGFRYTQNKNVGWALTTGIFLGLMHATKETSIIAFASMALAMLLIYLSTSRQNRIKIQPLHIAIAIAGAAVISVLFYSSFFSNPRGVIDSVLTYKTYIHRAGESKFHIHPWYYYLKMLIYSKYSVETAYNEAIIVIMAGLGFVVAVRKKNIIGANANLLRFIAFYTVTMMVIYSVISYKTPWCLLGFLHGMILLAGIGTVALIKFLPRISPKISLRIVTISFIVIASVDLLLQGYIGNFISYANPANPYVYAHTTKDIFNVTEQIDKAAGIHPDGRDMYIQVICDEDDYWPLPWYLRSFGKVAWLNSVDENAPSAELIIASPGVEKALVKKLYEAPEPGQKNMYVPLFNKEIYLRPHVELRGYITKELWDKLPQMTADEK